MTIIDGIRAPLSIFFEHTYGVGYILEAAEFHYPFKKVLLFLIILTIGVSLGMIFTVYVGDCLIEKERPKLKRKIKMMLYEKVKDVDLKCYDNPDFYNNLVLAVNESDKQIERCSTFLKNTFSGIVAFLSTGFYFLHKDKYSILFVAVSFIIVFFANKAFNRINYKVRIESNAHERKREYVKRVFYLADYAKEIRQNPDITKKLFKDFDAANNSVYEVEKKNSCKRLWTRYLSTYVGNDFFNDVLYVIYLVLRASINHGLPISSVAILYRNFNNLKDGMKVFTNTYPYACETSLYIQKIKDFLLYENELKSRVNAHMDSSPKDIAIKNISFAYSNKNKKTIDNISFHISKGEKIALVGYNGAGKTTLVKLLMRLYDADSGEIRINDLNIKDYNITQYRKGVGTVFQDYKLFAGTIKENVVMDVLKGSDAENQRIQAALKASGLSEKVASLPAKEETQITTELYENGVNLSGGESQKLAIARIFYEDAGLFILDEPSSALDPIAEYQLNQTLMNSTNGKTVIFISHRLSTTRLADRIIMLEKGRVVEEGTHEELLSINGKYARMWNVQAGPYL